VFNTPIRHDIVQFVQSNLRKNRRVPYSVAKWAGTQTSAESWGTGRAVARIPRVPGGGTHRAGQGAFGNMCRGGRMFAPTRTWRRWHRKVNLNQKRYAVASAIAASAVTSLVLARGHQIWQIPEVPLVVATDAVEQISKTKNALALLTSLHANPDVERCHVVKKNTGKARLRNRAKQIKVGPLIITGPRSNCYKAFRNLAGVQTTSVISLNLLLLAPGGHLGRFIIWTKAAFEQLNSIFGSADKPSEVKHGYFLPRPVLTNPDVRRIVQSDAIQALRNAKPARFVKVKRVNFLKNKKAMDKINPYSAHARKYFINVAKQRIASRLKQETAPKKGKKTHRKVALARALNGKRLKKGDKKKSVTFEFAAKSKKYKHLVFGQ